MTKKLLLAFHGLLFLGLSILAFITDGSGGGGDSLTHYFFAEIAWQRPINLLDLWAKPFFTLVASPFAQFGFIGMKLFTIFCGVASSYFASLSAGILKKPWYWAIPILAFVGPVFYTYLFSGLTEPFAALVSILSVWLCLRGHVAAGFILASFLPFSRTEAQVFLLFFAAFGLFNGHVKKLPLLLTGYVIYSLVGWLAFDTPLWIFDHPYNASGSAYGQGQWYHYINRLQVMLAVPGIILAGLGLIQLAINLIQKKISWKRELILVHGLFFSLLVGHSLVWALGIYGSAGLERTLITSFPFLWIIMLDGLILLKKTSAWLFRSRAYILPLLYLPLQIYISWDSRVGHYYFDTHLRETPNNRFFRDEVAPYILKNFPEQEHYMISDPYMALPLDVNYKNPERVSSWALFQYPESVPENTLYIYDSYYVPSHDGISLEQTEKVDYLREIESWQTEGGHIYAIYRRSDQE